MESKWLPIDIFFMGSGYPFTNELTKATEKKFIKMGYKITNAELLQKHEKRMGKFYKFKDCKFKETAGAKIIEAS
jgi:hypothetical protein